MNTKQTEALKLALEALENPDALDEYNRSLPDVAITAIREALTQSQEKYTYGTPLLNAMMGVAEQPAQQQEPCKVCGGTGEVETGIGMMVCDGCRGTTYTAPPAQPSKPLTDEQIKKMAAPLFMSHYWNLCNEFARAIEAAHGIKGEA